mmetsp:Transcript_75036/g.208626  ORF Transcript_75036/g.208626 Transcript_75036/m.208626 type:complete len:419 (-) Transcript_75036:166-1422(-)|eukprot:CAMPEP_0117535884 /NCGR_PEP_ID=MMETSP0784-20121206/41163_1 /TAXON_ID=39447 /ORGANISM="" /LENGTH=418 /DNA_ID=CAMNT_0005332421 /DNA_START=128 /DNA_END=1384 /DNA_ORIENTATION=+
MEAILERKRRREEGTAGNVSDTKRASTRALSRLNENLRKATGSSERAACDDEDGYYVATVDEAMGERYVITETACGKGVFSSVVKAQDTSLDAIMAAESNGPLMVAIKVVRAIAGVQEAAKKEVEILRKLQGASGEGKRYIVQMLDTFSHQNHLCMVFECMWDDCREALRKLTKGRGMTISSVRTFASQLLLGLGHFEKCSILHADIKPDNILLSKDLKSVKICDLGTAAAVSDFEVSPDIMSRAYRAPEIIIGCKPSTSADMFALGCTLFELFTGKVLAAGQSNHDQLRKIMEVKGKLPSAVIKRGMLWKSHFDESLAFRPDDEAAPKESAAEEDSSATTLRTNRLKVDQAHAFPKHSIKSLVIARVGPERCKSAKPEDQQYVIYATRFAALLEDLLSLDPSGRPKSKGALAHEFFI